jgi:hypothetical protein
MAFGDFGSSNRAQTHGRLPGEILGAPFQDCSGSPDLKACQRLSLLLIGDRLRGHGIRAKRSKSGAISFDLLDVENSRAAL